LNELTIYTTSWCQYCCRAKAALEARGIAYREIDIERHPEWASKVEAWNGGNRTVPTFVVGTTVVTYRDRARLEELIGVEIP
jgi:mycoredoxin